MKVVAARLVAFALVTIMLGDLLQPAAAATAVCLRPCQLQRNRRLGLRADAPPHALAGRSSGVDTTQGGFRAWWSLAKRSSPVDGLNDEDAASSSSGNDPAVTTDSITEPKQQQNWTPRPGDDTKRRVWNERMRRVRDGRANHRDHDALRRMRGAVKAHFADWTPAEQAAFNSGAMSYDEFRTLSALHHARYRQEQSKDKKSSSNRNAKKGGRRGRGKGEGQQKVQRQTRRQSRAQRFAARQATADDYAARARVTDAGRTAYQALKAKMTGGGEGGAGEPPTPEERERWRKIVEGSRARGAQRRASETAEQREARLAYARRANQVRREHWQRQGLTERTRLTPEQLEARRAYYRAYDERRKEARKQQRREKAAEKQRLKEEAAAAAAAAEAETEASDSGGGGSKEEVTEVLGGDPLPDVDDHASQVGQVMTPPTTDTATQRPSGNAESPGIYGIGQHEDVGGEATRTSPDTRAMSVSYARDTSPMTLRRVASRLSDATTTWRQRAAGVTHMRQAFKEAGLHASVVSARLNEAAGRIWGQLKSGRVHFRSMPQHPRPFVLLH